MGKSRSNPFKGFAVKFKGFAKTFKGFGVKFEGRVVTFKEFVVTFKWKRRIETTQRRLQNPKAGPVFSTRLNQP